MKRIPKQEYTEFKEQAVERAQEVVGGVAARELAFDCSDGALRTCQARRP